MVTMQDRALIEARAKGIDIEAALRNPFRQLIKPDIVISAFAISVFLLIYYAAVGFLVIYMTTAFTFSVNEANSLANWEWAMNAVLGDPRRRAAPTGSGCASRSCCSAASPAA